MVSEQKALRLVATRKNLLVLPHDDNADDDDTVLSFLGLFGCRISSLSRFGDKLLVAVPFPKVVTVWSTLRLHLSSTGCIRPSSF